MCWQASPVMRCLCCLCRGHGEQGSAVFPLAVSLAVCDKATEWPGAAGIPSLCVPSFYFGNAERLHPEIPGSDWRAEQVGAGTGFPYIDWPQWVTVGHTKTQYGVCVWSRAGWGSLNNRTLGMRRKGKTRHCKVTLHRKWRGFQNQRDVSFPALKLVFSQLFYSEHKNVLMKMASPLHRLV